MSEPELFPSGPRRLPYYFTFVVEEKLYVLCPQCALERVSSDHADRLKPRYGVPYSVMCARCAITMGPIKEEETQDG